MDTDANRIKRRRSLSSSSSSSSGQSDQSRSPSPAPAHKYHRATPPTDGSAFTCNLPPTCSQPETSTSYATEAELLRHQDVFHRWICRTPVREKIHNTPDYGVPESFVGRGGKRAGWKECGKVFPEERLLTLHHSETHDPLTREKQHRGEKIFKCFIPAPECTRKFLTPAKRRRHLIDKHKYPQQYFFSITNHGINQIAQQDGLAFSLIRPRRDPPPKETSVSPAVDRSALPQVQLHNGTLRPQIEGVLKTDGVSRSAQPENTTKTDDPVDIDMDGVTESINSSLRLVPKVVRKQLAAKNQNSTRRPEESL